ncbi:hypothetical protein [Streptomyces sp. C10-9-1]|uniref:hypothetical protein n=1 Tax=Streptomyces sp. C10-9-1 TaxID=1859285 RepID=UPI003D750F59
MAIKRCTSAFAAVIDGVPRVVPAGTLVEEDDPILKGRSAHFEDVDTYVSRRRRAVEAATAEPGERRSLPPRRAAKKAAGKKPEGGQQDAGQPGKQEGSTS